MPRRGSRAQLLRDIAAWESRFLRDDEAYLDWLLEEYKQYSTEQLRELAEREGIEPQPRGRPNKHVRYQLKEDRDLVRAVEALMRFHGVSVVAACRAFAARKHLRLPSGKKARTFDEALELLRPYHATSGEALRRHYYRAKRRLPKR